MMLNNFTFNGRHAQRLFLVSAPLAAGSAAGTAPDPHTVAPIMIWWSVAAILVLLAVIILLLRIMLFRKRTAQDLRDAALKYRIVADNTYDWEFWISPEGEFVYSSPSCECVTGHGVEEFLADPGLLRSIVHPDDLRRFEQHANDVMLNMRPGELQCRIVLPDGSVRWIDHICMPVFDDNGQFIGTRGSNRDSTERKRAEEALRENELRFRSMLETIPLGVLEVDVNGVITLANESFSGLTGYGREDIPGKHFWEFMTPGQSQEGFPAYLQLLVRDQPPPVPFFGKGATRDGRAIDIQIDWTYKRNTSGEVVGFVGVVSDVTERTTLERMKDEMISSVSHEMRTPLTAMLGFSEFLLENRVDEAQLHDYLGIIHRETGRLNELINNFLDLQRIRAGQAVYHLTTFAVQPLLEEAAALFAAAPLQHTITVRPCSDLPLLTGDEGRLHQVLNNLLSNAVKYSPVNGEIVLDARQEGGFVIIRVEDQGIGIPPEKLEKIFDRFYRVDATDRRATGGTGLGLALVREIVQAHGGRVWVESTEGKGSKFSFSLPIIREESGTEQ
jgi:two-component system phosphate regulon sensor histidine kinase PhoR